MRIYSDILMRHDIRSALPEGTYLEEFRDLEIVRLRKRGWQVLLGSYSSSRHFNTGTHGSGEQGAATHDQWGHFLAALYDLDPNMRAGFYYDREDFHRITNWKYDTPTLDCPICDGKHFERAGIENCAADHEIDPPGGWELRPAMHVCGITGYTTQENCPACGKETP